MGQEVEDRVCFHCNHYDWAGYQCLFADPPQQGVPPFHSCQNWAVCIPPDRIPLKAEKKTCAGCHYYHQIPFPDPDIIEEAGWCYLQPPCPTNNYPRGTRPIVMPLDFCSQWRKNESP
jgi:hypothetical protein